jgi:hypothetical protein
MDPKPIYTIGFSSIFALVIHSKREGGGVQLRSGLSKNQLQSVIIRCGFIDVQGHHSLSRDNGSIGPVERFWHDRLDDGVSY